MTSQPLATPTVPVRRVPSRGRALLAALVLVILGGSLTTAAQTPAGADTIPVRRIVTGWLPYWSTSTSVADLTANKDLFTEASPFWFSATGTTTITAHLDATTRASATSTIHAAGIGVWPTVTDGMPAHGMAAVLTNATTRAQHVAALVATVTANGYEGIDLDYEKFAFSDGSATWPTTRGPWVAFVQQLSAALHAKGKKLAVTVPVMYTTTTGYWVYDYAAIGPYVDRLRIMTYDYSTSHAGPIAPLSWVQKVAAFAVTQLAPGKIQLGVPAYGYDWPATTTGCPVDNLPVRQSLTSQAALALATSLGRTATWDATNAERTFSYSKTYTGHNAAGAAASCTIARTVWFEDATAAVTRARLISTYGVGGVALWTVGGEQPSTWSGLRAYADSITPKNTYVTAHALTPHVQYGQPATIQAVLRTLDNHPVPNAPVVLQGKRDGGGLWSSLGTYTTSASGVVNAVHTPTAQTSYRFVFATTGNARGSTSPVATVTVEIAPALVYTTIGYHTVSGRQWYTTCAALQQHLDPVRGGDLGHPGRPDVDRLRGPQRLGVQQPHVPGHRGP